MDGRFGSGSGNLAGRASWKSHRFDAIGLGHRVHSGGAAVRRDPTLPRLALAVSGGKLSGAADGMDSPRHSRTGDLDEGAKLTRARCGDAAPFRLIGKPPLLGKAVLATLLSSSLMCAYWGLFTWIPAYLSSPVSKGGAGLSILQSTVWIIPVQIGALFGYALFGVLADRFGRRPVLIVFLVGAAIVAPLYGLAGRNQTILLMLGPLIGFFGHGFFSVFGAMLAELFPSPVRATAQGLCYNTGRGIGALAPLLIGSISDRSGVGAALACTSAFFVAGALLSQRLPETKGEVLQ